MASWTERLYAGEVFHWDASTESRALADLVRSFVVEEFASERPREAAAALPPDEVFARVGWQDRDAGLRERYPASARPSTRTVGFAAKYASVVAFAGAHLHQTLPQDTGRARFSFDFRVVDLRDHDAGRGAPSVDNRSKGTALGDYLRWNGGA